MIDLLRPYKISNSSKVRLGPPHDGGYVLSNTSLDKSQCLFTYGVGANYDFEIDYVNKFNKPVYMFDPTMKLNSTPYNIYFYKEGLGNKELCYDFIEHWNRLGEKRIVILKIDIEGDEYDYFLSANIGALSNICSGILIEFHGLDYLNYQEKFVEIAKRLNDYFVLTHIHGNSFSPLFNFNGTEIPITVELSYDNRNYVSIEGLDKSEYPISCLDFSNNPESPDLSLKFIKDN